MSVVAIVPIKHYSARVPGKNFRLMNGKPLYFYILNTLRSMPEINAIIVNTDSEDLKARLHVEFPEVLIHERPKHLRGNNVSTNAILEETITTLDLGNCTILQTHATNPLLSADTIRRALEEYRQDEKEHSSNDSLFGVNEHHTRLYSEEGDSINHDVLKLIPTQDLPPIYEENSCIYIFDRSTFMKRMNRIGENPKMFVVPKLEAQDIDWEEDFLLTEILQQRQLNNKKVVVVTGSSGGIGAGICKVFKEKGWTVVGFDTKVPEHKYCDGYLRGSILDLVSIEDMIQEVSKVSNKRDIHCLVNNAAYQFCETLTHTSAHEWDKVMNTNLKAPYILVKRLFGSLKNVKGCVVNISSVHAVSTSSGIGAYGVSKAAIAGMTRTMALELAPHGIRVNGIMPGAIDTPMLRSHLSEDEVKAMGKRHPIGRIGTPEEIGEWVYFLADNQKSGFMTGQNVVIDGGATIALSTEV